MSNPVSYLDPVQLKRDLGPRDLSDAGEGPHAIQILIDMVRARSRSVPSSAARDVFSHSRSSAAKSSPPASFGARVRALANWRMLDSARCSGAWPRSFSYCSARVSVSLEHLRHIARSRWIGYVLAVATPGRYPLGRWAGRPAAHYIHCSGTPHSSHQRGVTAERAPC